MRYLREAIEAMAGYAPGEQPAPESRALKLNTNENPYPPSPRVLQALRESDWSVLRRYPDPMANKARDAIAALWGLGRDEVLCGNGSDELLALIVRAAVEPGEAIAYPVPTYSLFPVLAEVQGARVLEVPSPEDFSVPLEALAKAQAKVVFLCTPNAPTGVWTPPEAVARLADRFPGLLVVDEAYADFAPASAVPAVRGRANVLVLRTLSKSYSLAGLRFGYAVGSKDLIAGLAKVKDSYNIDGVTIEVAAAALRDQAHLTECVKKVRAERSRLSAALEGLGLRVVPSEANFLLAAVPDGDARAWYEHLKARGILVRYWDQPRLRDKLRITIGTPEEDDRLLEALRARCKESRP